jgi:hypothetical protein
MRAVLFASATAFRAPGDAGGPELPLDQPDHTENTPVFRRLRLLVSLMFFGPAFLYKRRLFLVWFGV